MDPFEQFRRVIADMQTKDPTSVDRWQGSLVLCGNAMIAACLLFAERRARWDQILAQRDVDATHQGLMELADAFAELMSIGAGVQSVCERIDATYREWRPSLKLPTRASN